MNAIQSLEENTAVDLFASQQGMSSHPLDPDTQGECRLAIAALDLQPGECVLDAPCGNGRHAFNLAMWGLRVTGIDIRQHAQWPAPPLRDGAVAPTFEVSDIRALDRPGHFDAAVSFYSFIGYFADRQGDDGAMAALSASLKPGGRLLMGTANAGALPQGAERTEIPFGDQLIVREDWFDEAQARLRRRLRVVDAAGETRESLDHHRHVYSATALDALLHRHGLEVEARYSNYHLGAFDGATSRHQVVVARKRVTPGA